MWGYLKNFFNRAHFKKCTRFIQSKDVLHSNKQTKKQKTRKTRKRKTKELECLLLGHKMKKEGRGGELELAFCLCFQSNFTFKVKSTLKVFL